MLRGVTAGTVPVDRRHRRRLETIEEVLDHAVQIMTEEGVAGLSLGEIARRMGIRTPSLYVYFPSKHALYDALFARGAREIERVVGDETARLMVDLDVHPERTAEEVLLDAAAAFVRWAVEHPAYTQLLYWRPVPGFEPSAESFAPAIAMVAKSRQRFVELQRRGLIRRDAAIDDVQRDWAVLMTGVVTRQLANEPNVGFDKGRLTTVLSALISMFARHYGAAPSTTAPSTSTRGSRRARQR
jgi:AcrR family transcriptional regulator